VGLKFKGIFLYLSWGLVFLPIPTPTLLGWLAIDYPIYVALVPDILQ